jgi:PAS domain S-box-containing protein
MTEPRDKVSGAGEAITAELERAEEALRTSEERFRLIVENARDYAIFTSDPEDRIDGWYAGAAAIFGWTAAEITGQPAAILFTPEDRARRAPEWETETAKNEGVAPNVRWHLRNDGSLVFIEGSVTALRDASGRLQGFLKIGQDVTERYSAQEALRLSERQMRLLAEGIPQLVFRSLGTGERSWGSPQWVQYTGLTLEESLGLGWLEAVHPDDRQATMDAWPGAEAGGEYYVEHRLRNGATGEYRWHQTRAAPLREEGSEASDWLGTSTDVEEIRSLYRHQQTLLAELQHRVRNTLAVMRSITRRTAESSESVDEMASHLQGRLDAFARVQAVVTRNPESGVDLAALIEDEFLAHAAREGEHLRIEGPDISLKPRPAETLSLAIHELATNSVKYGALAAGGGHIAVEWKRELVEGGERLELIWEESGLSAPLEEPRRQGFGLELLQRTLPYDLRAETRVEFRSSGLRFAMLMPLGADVLAQPGALSG